MTQSGHLARVRAASKPSLFDPTLALESREFGQAADRAMKFILEVRFGPTPDILLLTKMVQPPNK
jgi:hypothetical protein